MIDLLIQSLPELPQNLCFFFYQEIDWKKTRCGISLQWSEINPRFNLHVYSRYYILPDSLPLETLLIDDTPKAKKKKEGASGRGRGRGRGRGAPRGRARGRAARR